MQSSWVLPKLETVETQKRSKITTFDLKVFSCSKEWGHITPSWHNHLPWIHEGEQRMQILERHPLEEHDRVLMLRHFAEDFEKVRAACRQNDTVSGKHPSLRAEDHISEGVMPPQILYHCSKVLLVIIPPQNKFFSCHSLFALLSLFKSLGDGLGIPSSHSKGSAKSDIHHKLTQLEITCFFTIMYNRLSCKKVKKKVTKDPFISPQVQRKFYRSLRRKNSQNHTKPYWILKNA